MAIRKFFSLAALAIAACDTPQSIAPLLLGGAELASESSQQVVGHANGAGVVNVGVPMDFVFNALLRADGSATGEGYHHALLGENVIEFRTRVTCVSIDPVFNRAWVGGVITENNSTDPARMQPRNQPGRDIWWRVVDYGDGQSGTVDRSTFIGFTGDANIQTSAEYCAVRPWPGPGDTPPQPQDARTNPLLSGNISVMLK
jgi:hypothetical protein